MCLYRAALRLRRLRRRAALRAALWRAARAFALHCKPSNLGPNLGPSEVQLGGQNTRPRYLGGQIPPPSLPRQPSRAVQSRPARESQIQPHARSVGMSERL